MYYQHAKHGETRGSGGMPHPYPRKILRIGAAI